MVEISLSGSGEGSGRATGRGYSTNQAPKKEKSGTVAALYSLRSITYVQRIAFEAPMKRRWVGRFVKVC